MIKYHLASSSVPSYIETKYVFRHQDEPHPVVGTEPLGRHFHTGYELLYFLRGDAEYQIQQNLYSLRAHSLLIIRPGEYHMMITRSSKRMDRIVIHFSEDDISPELRDSLSSLGNVYFIPGTRLSDEILRLDTYYQDLNSDLRLNAMISQLHIILSYLCNLVGMRQQPDQVDRGVEWIISYIHSNLSSIRTLDDICQNVHMSRSTVQNMISDYLQTPVMSYVRTQKCILAKTLLQKGHSATEVCVQCGFGDYSSFYRAYRKVYGSSPSAMPQGQRLPQSGDGPSHM